MRIGSLFSGGLDGLSLGLSAALDAEVALTAERDPWRRAQLERQGLVDFVRRAPYVRRMAKVTKTPGTDGAAKEAKEATVEAEGLLATVREFRITTRGELELAAEGLADVKGRLKKLEAREKEITSPLNAALKSARALFRPAKEALAEVEGVIKASIARFSAEEEQRNRLAVQEAADAHEAGDAAGVEDALAKVATVAAVEGLSTYEKWDFLVEDASLVPREFCVVSETLLREHAAHTPKGDDPPPVPGVRFFRRTVVASRSS